MRKRSARLVMLPLLASMGIIVAWVLVAHMRGGTASVMQDGGEGAVPVVTSSPDLRLDSGSIGDDELSGGASSAEEGASDDAASSDERAGGEGSEGAGIGEMADGNGSPDDERCPIDLGEARFVSEKCNSTGRAWRYRSDQPMVVLAERMLAQLERDGWMLVDASQADLLGEAWNCVAMNASDNRVLLITITPEIWGGVRDGDASSLVSIVRFEE